MTITKLANEINRISKEEAYLIAGLPASRKQYYKLNRLPDFIFQSKSIFESDGYAYHFGGRGELQFNIGVDYLNNKEVVRYGLAFSLEPSEALPDPVRALEVYKNRYNKCIVDFPKAFRNLKMWFHAGIGSNRKLTRQNVQEIDDNIFAIGNFIFIGDYFDKPLKDIEIKDIQIILNYFDQILPIYRYCVLEDEDAFTNENRIAKICWNDNDWICPSGLYGKSKDPKSFEREHGYGNEEWLFDFDKLIDGYHYCLLQAAQSGRNNHLSKLGNVKLYSQNSDTRQIYWVGFIKNLQVYSNEKESNVHLIYKQNGWINEMSEQIKEVNGDYAHILNLAYGEIFNVRFRPENAQLFKPPILVTDFDKTIGTYRYVFVKDESNENLVEREVERRHFVFRKGANPKSLDRRTSKRKESTVQVDPLHDRIQESLCKLLIEEYGDDFVGTENDTGLNTRIDITVESPDGLFLYEVKSYSSVMYSIRVALGQLLEYAYWPEPIPNLKELIIVSHIEADTSVKKYMRYLRQITSLNVYYQQYNVTTNELSEKV